MVRVRPPVLATQVDREQAAVASVSIRSALIGPGAAGERSIIHVDLSRPRRGLWLTTWRNLPGLTFDAGRKAYTHSLLPGWEYTVSEMRTEMIEDLDKLAATGERPTKATRKAK